MTCYWSPPILEVSDASFCLGYMLGRPWLTIDLGLWWLNLQPLLVQLLWLLQSWSYVLITGIGLDPPGLICLRQLWQLLVRGLPSWKWKKGPGAGPWTWSCTYPSANMGRWGFFRGLHLILCLGTPFNMSFKCGQENSDLGSDSPASTWVWWIITEYDFMDWGANPSFTRKATK